MRRRDYNRRIVNELKAHPCADCGNTFPPEAMDFDHVRGVKLANVSRLIAGPTSLLLAEIDKCVLVCASCHRSRTLFRLEEGHVQAALDADADAELAGLPFEDAPDA